MEIVAVANQKGGVGKTASVINVGAALAEKGFKVLLIDLDSQENLSFSFNVCKSSPSILEVLTGKASIQDAIKHLKKFDIIPSSLFLSTYEGSVESLKRMLKPLKDNYDYILIDTPPALSKLTLSALTAANSVIIPTTVSAFSLQGIGQFAQTLEIVKAKVNKNLTVKGVLLTRCNVRTRIFKEYQKVGYNLKYDCLNGKPNYIINECSAVREAELFGEDIFSYAPKSKAAADYMRATVELFDIKEG